MDLQVFSFPPCSYLLLITLLLSLLICKGVCVSGGGGGGGRVTRTFTFTNKCDYTVWPGILSSAGIPPLESTGFELTKGTTSRSFQAPPGWSGRFWGRTICNFDDGSGQGNCATGDCGSGQVECNGAGAAPPVTLAEFTLGEEEEEEEDFYDVSLVDGYNLAMVVEAVGGSGRCVTTGCVTDLNQQCPTELKVGNGTEACKSACEAFGSPEYCCSGEYGSPSTCRPSVYSELFKSVCPRSYSYAYDDATSTFTCMGADYLITFCPSEKSSRDSSSVPTTTTTGSEAGAAMLADGSWLQGLATADSTKSRTTTALQSTSTFIIITASFILS